MHDTFTQLLHDTLRLAAFLSVYLLWMAALVAIARVPAVLRLIRRIRHRRHARQLSRW